jgi:hypothetical protein
LNLADSLPRRIKLFVVGVLLGCCWGVVTKMGLDEVIGLMGDDVEAWRSREQGSKPYVLFGYSQGLRAQAVTLSS